MSRNLNFFPFLLLAAFRYIGVLAGILEFENVSFAKGKKGHFCQRSYTFLMILFDRNCHTIFLKQLQKWV